MDFLDPHAIGELRESVGDDSGFLASLISDFLLDAHVLYEQLQQALTDGTLEAAGRASHTLKSSAALMGADLLSHTCNAIEMAAREEDLPGAQQAGAKLETIFNGTEEALLALRDTL